MKNHKKWITKISKLLFSHQRLALFEDVVLLPNGKEITYLKFGQTNDSVTVIAQREDGKILLLSEYSYPPDKWLYEFPGGSVQNKETIKQAALREFIEESGYSFSETKLLGKYYIDNRRSNSQMFVFFATNLSKSFLKSDDEEFFEYHWFTIDEINELILKGEIVNAHVLAPWTLFRSNC